MKYHELSPAPKLTVRRATAVAMLEHAGLLDRMERAGWLRPVEKTAQIELYSVEDIKDAVKRMKVEKLPV